MEIFLAICLLVLGLLVGLFGYKLFKVIMPVAGLIIGASIGFTGFQGVFGTGVTSTTLAVLVAVVFGLALAGLSFAFFDIALVIFMGLAMSTLATLLGLALGLSASSFVLGMLSLSGFIIGLMIGGSSKHLTKSFVTLVTAYVGTGLMLGGLFLLTTGVSLTEMYENGVIATASQYAGQSFWWILVWIASFVIMRQIQIKMILLDIFPKDFEYHESK